MPVAAKMALHKAGAMGGTPGSPTPPSSTSLPGSTKVHSNGLRRQRHARYLILMEIALLGRTILEVPRAFAVQSFVAELAEIGHKTVVPGATCSDGPAER